MRKAIQRQRWLSQTASMDFYSQCSFKLCENDDLVNVKESWPVAKVGGGATSAHYITSCGRPINGTMVKNLRLTPNRTGFLMFNN